MAKDPKDENTLLALTRARISAGQAKTGTSLEGETPRCPSRPATTIEGALEAWTRYLNLVGEDANPVAAQLVAQTFSTLAERGSSTLEEIEENGATALRAQQIAAAERPNLNSLSSLALYEYFHGDFDAGDKAAQRAIAITPNKQEAKNIEKQLDQLRKRGEQYQKSVAQFKARRKKPAPRENRSRAPSASAAAPPAHSANRPQLKAMPAVLLAASIAFALSLGGCGKAEEPRPQGSVYRCSLPELRPC